MWIEVNWKDNSQDEDRFEIERQTEVGVFFKIGEVPKNVTTFSDENIEEGKKYTYRVRACKDGNCSNSPEATVTSPRKITFPGGSPDKPKCQPDQPGGNLQTCIDELKDGDVILIKPDTYAISLEISKRLTLTTEFPGVPVTIKAQGKVAAISIKSDDVTIDSLIITHEQPSGTGIVVTPGKKRDIKLVNNFICGNGKSSPMFPGAGILIFSDVQVEIKGNSVGRRRLDNNCKENDGDGILVLKESKATIENNVILSNKGCGIKAENRLNVNGSGNRIAGNGQGNLCNVSEALRALKIRVPEDFDTIQEAIKFAENGDTIEVEPKTKNGVLSAYVENLTIDKILTLKSTNQKVFLWAGKGTGVSVSGKVTIEGFDIQGESVGIELAGLEPEVKIRDSSLKNDIGLKVSADQAGKIQNIVLEIRNTKISSKEDGIRIEGKNPKATILVTIEGQETTIESPSGTDKGNGITITGCFDPNSSSMEVDGITIQSYRDGIHMDVKSFGQLSVIATGLNNNTGRGIFLNRSIDPECPGIDIVNVELKSTTITRSGLSGIEVQGKSISTKIFGSTIDQNGQNCPPPPNKACAGIKVGDSAEVTVQNSTIVSGNNVDGVLVGAPTSIIKIERSTVNDNEIYGIAAWVWDCHRDEGATATIPGKAIDLGGNTIQRNGWKVAPRGGNICPSGFFKKP